MILADPVFWLVVAGIAAVILDNWGAPPGAKGEMSYDFWLNVEIDYAEDMDDVHRTPPTTAA